MQFTNVTEDSKHAGGSKSACIKYINFIQKLNYYDLKYVLPNGNYDNSVYTNFHRIPDSQFTYVSSGDFGENKIGNAFDEDSRAFWVAEKESDGTTGSHIIVNFNKPTLFEGLLIQGYEYTSNRKTTYPGFPLKVKFYYSLNNEEFVFHTKFSGEPSNKKEVYQYILSEKVLCDNIKIEFVDVMFDSRISNKNSAAINKITLYQSFENEGLPFQGANGIYADSNYLSNHIVADNEFSIRSLGGDHPDHPIADARDESDTTYWVSKYVNTDTYHNEVVAEFNNPLLLEAVLFDPVYESVNGRTFSGFPIRFKIYSALENNDYSLVASYVEMPDASMTRIQFVSTKELYAAAARFVFVKKAEYQLLAYHRNEGYTESHLIPKSKFVYWSTGDRSEYPIDNAFDDKADSFWSSSFEIQDQNYPSIFINFTQRLKLEGFLLGIFYKKIALTNHYAGYPKRLNVYVANEEDPLKLAATFVGDPDDIEFYQFSFREPIIWSRLQLEFIEVTTNWFYETDKKLPSLSYVKLLGEIIDFSSSDLQEDFTTQQVNSSFPFNGINDTNLVVNDLPNDNDYLFIIEKQFYFDNVSFSCPNSPMSAIKSNHSNSVTVVQCQFTSCSVKNEIGNGGAILLLNCVLKCENSDFSNCTSKINGGGGGIFVHLKEEINDKLTIDHCNFNNCSATYGGALYLFSNVLSNNIVVKRCVFKSNSLLNPTDSTNSMFIGGSAMYIHALRTSTVRCKFVSNIGDCSMKINNDFENIPSQLENENDRNSNVLIEKCEFELDLSSKSSLSYIRGSAKGVNIDVKNCVFIGELLENNYHIHVESHNIKTEKPKLKIQSCKFSSDKTKIFNLNDDSKYNSLILFDDNFNDSTQSRSEKSNSKSIIIISLAIIGVAVIAILFVFVSLLLKGHIVDKNDSLNPIDENNL